MVETVTTFIKYWDAFFKLDMLKIFKKLGVVYDSDKWSPTYHTEVDESVIKWLYLQVLPHLALNQDLPLQVRYVKDSEFIENMRNWLKIGFLHKRKHTIGKR